MRLPNPIFIKKQLPSLSKTTFSYFGELGRFCCPPLFSSRQVLNQIFPALAAHGIARNYGNLLLSTLKTSFSYFEKIGFSGLQTLPVSRQVLNQNFPALAAHGIARNYGTFPPARPGSRMHACARAPLGCGVAYVPISPCMCISRSILNLYVYILHLLMFYLYLHRYTCMCTQIIKLFIYIYIIYIYTISKI